MTWEIALNVGFIGTGFLLLYFAINNRSEQERMFPLYLIFVTLAMMFAMMSLQSSAMILEANRGTINDDAVTNSLKDIVENGTFIFNWIFWIFLLITAFSIILVVINYLLSLKWKNK